MNVSRELRGTAPSHCRRSGPSPGDESAREPLSWKRTWRGGKRTFWYHGALFRSSGFLFCLRNAFLNLYFHIQGEAEGRRCFETACSLHLEAVVASSGGRSAELCCEADLKCCLFGLVCLRRRPSDLGDGEEVHRRRQMEVGGDHCDLSFDRPWLQAEQSPSPIMSVSGVQDLVAACKQSSTLVHSMARAAASRNMVNAMIFYSMVLFIFLPPA